MVPVKIAFVLLFNPVRTRSKLRNNYAICNNRLEVMAKCSECYIRHETQLERNEKNVIIEFDARWEVNSHRKLLSHAHFEVINFAAKVHIITTIFSRIDSSSRIYPWWWVLCQWRSYLIQKNTLVLFVVAEIIYLSNNSNNKNADGFGLEKYRNASESAILSYKQHQKYSSGSKINDSTTWRFSYLLIFSSFFPLVPFYSDLGCAGQTCGWK